MPSTRYGIRLFVGFTLGLGVACNSPTETPEFPEKVVAEQPVACDSVIPTYDGYSRVVTHFTSFHDFATTATIKQGVAGYLFILEGDAMPCAVTSPSDRSCNRRMYINPLEGTVAAYSDPITAGAHCVAKTETDGLGAYQLELEPGRYRLRLLDEEGFEKDVWMYGFSSATTEPIWRSSDVEIEIELGIMSFHLVEDNRSSAPTFQ